MMATHDEATRPEPPDGSSREMFVKALMKQAWRGPWQVPINTREEVATGRALHPRFCDLLDVMSGWVAHAGLTRLDGLILLLHFGPPDRTLSEVARRLNMGRSAVYRRRHDLIESFARWYWDEPDYVLPARERATADVRAMIHDELSDLDWD